MTRAYNANSIEAKIGVVGKIAPSQRDVLEAIRSTPGVTRKELESWSSFTYSPSRIRTAVRELLDAKAVFESGDRVIDGRRHACLFVEQALKQKRLF